MELFDAKEILPDITKECLVCGKQIEMKSEDESFYNYLCCGIPQSVFKLKPKKRKE